jgi:hypothetical protein
VARGGGPGTSGPSGYGGKGGGDDIGGGSGGGGYYGSGGDGGAGRNYNGSATGVRITTVGTGSPNVIISYRAPPPVTDGSFVKSIR